MAKSVALDPAESVTLGAGAAVRLKVGMSTHAAGEIGLVVRQNPTGTRRYEVMIPGDPSCLLVRSRDLEVLQGTNFEWWLRTGERALGAPPAYEWGVQVKDRTDSDWDKPETLRLSTRGDSLDPPYTEESARARVEQISSGPAGPDFARVVKRAVGRWVPC